MVHELKKNIEAKKVLFGIRQVLKNSANLERAVVPRDCRQDVVSLLSKNKIDVELLEFSKQDLSNKLELEFECEVFGVKK